jgi:ABC-type transport system involved in multi-copper enzyme maturation permease subunit
VTDRILAIAKNTFREAVRGKLFVAIGIFGLILMASSAIVGPLSLGEQARITQDLGLAGMSMLGFMVAVLIGTGIVYTEVERRTIYTVIAKPVERWQFVLGKFAGLNATITVLVVGMTVILIGTAWVEIGHFKPQLFQAVLLTWIELMVLTSLSILMSVICSPILGAIFTFLLYIIGHTSGDLRDLAQHFGTGGVKTATNLAYYVLPNLEYFNIRGKVIHGVHVDAAYMVFACAYGLLYCVAFLVLAGAIFQRKEFK